MLRHALPLCAKSGSKQAMDLVGRLSNPSSLS
jgi:hypothetical protein